jgi:hypothetical protein
LQWHQDEGSFVLSLLCIQTTCVIDIFIAMSVGGIVLVVHLSFKAELTFTLFNHPK